MAIILFFFCYFCMEFLVLLFSSLFSLSLFLFLTISYFHFVFCLLNKVNYCRERQMHVTKLGNKYDEKTDCFFFM